VIDGLSPIGVAATSVRGILLNLLGLRRELSSEKKPIEFG
jgi:hypothetical protein